MARDCTRKFRVWQPDTTSGCRWSKSWWKWWIYSKWFWPWKPPCCSAGAGATRRPTSKLETCSLETFSERRMNNYPESFRCFGKGKLKKKKPGASTVSHGLPNLCQIYLTGNWRGNWLLAGSCTTYLHISMLPESDRLMMSSLYAWTYDSWWGVAHHRYLHCSLIFRQAFSGAVTRQGDVFLTCYTLGSYIFYDQCSLLFRQAWNANRRRSSIHFIHIVSAAWSSDGLFLEPLRGRVMFLICFGELHNYMITAARISDCTVILHRSSYSEIAAEVVTVQWCTSTRLLQLWWISNNMSIVMLCRSLERAAEIVCATLGALQAALYHWVHVSLVAFPEPIRGRVFSLFRLVYLVHHIQIHLIAWFLTGMEYGTTLPLRGGRCIWWHCLLHGDFIWFESGCITWFVATVSWCTSKFALRFTR